VFIVWCKRRFALQLCEEVRIWECPSLDANDGCTPVIFMSSKPAIVHRLMQTTVFTPVLFNLVVKICDCSSLDANDGLHSSCIYEVKIRWCSS
jgi:hypothetical protein